MYYFVAGAILNRGTQELEPGEQIEPVWVSFAQAHELAITGAIQEDRSVAVLLRWLHSVAGGGE